MTRDLCTGGENIPGFVCVSCFRRTGNVQKTCSCQADDTWGGYGCRTVSVVRLCYDVGYVSSAFLKLFLCVQFRQLHRSFHRRRRARYKSPAQSPAGSPLLQNVKKCSDIGARPLVISPKPPHKFFFPRESLRSGERFFKTRLKWSSWGGKEAVDLKKPALYHLPAAFYSTLVLAFNRKGFFILLLQLYI